MSKSVKFVSKMFKKVSANFKCNTLIKSKIQKEIRVVIVESIAINIGCV